MWKEEDSVETFFIVQRGEDIGRRYDLNMSQLTVGRGSDNDMVLNDPMVSRYHAVVKRQGDRIIIIDLGSANPVVVNDQVLEAGIPQQLQHRDVVFIGKTVFSFQSRATDARGRVGTTPRPTSAPLVPPAPAMTAGQDMMAAGATQMMTVPDLQPRVEGQGQGTAQPRADERQGATPPPTPTIETPVPPPVAAGGDDDARTVMFTPVDLPMVGQSGDDARTILSTAPPPPVGAGATAGNLPDDDDQRTILGGFRLPSLGNENEEPKTNPGLRAQAGLPPLPPLGGAEPAAGTPVDDAGENPTVFIPRERR